MVVTCVDMPTYNVIGLEKEIPNGITRPLLMKTDGGLFVVKHCQNDEGTKVLVNEFVCYKLANLLSIPIPNASLIYIRQDVIDADPKLKSTNIEPGLHFGSQFNKNANSAAVAPHTIDRMINKDDIPSIILFDQIIYNNDRAKNKGNLLIDIKNEEILAIDHSHAFRIGPLWNKYELERINSEQLCLVDHFHAYNYKVLLKYVNGHSPFEKIKNRIKSLQKKDVESCFIDLPKEWGFLDEEKLALIEFIWYRICNAGDFLTLLQNHCPNWKGGNR